MKPGHTDVTAHTAEPLELPGRYTTARCSAANSILARIGDKWSVLVVMSLADDTYRFNELKRLVDGISQRMLTLTLRGLERDGLVERTFYPTIPPKVSYALTELGRSLREPVGALGQWAIEHRGTVERSRQLYDRRSGEKDDAVPANGSR
ncbi:MAG: winged helix-turn-helix transcriptional regulator [Janthinobacterium lividum]